MCRSRTIVVYFGFLTHLMTELLFQIFSAQLAQMKRFKDKLPVIPQIGQIPHPTTDGDAVCSLLDICIQRQWPLAT